MDIEWWKYIKGYEGLYMVSNKGRVKSVDHYVNGKHGIKRLKKGKILKTTMNDRGYLYVTLFKNNKGKTCRIHRLVAQAFIPNPDNLPTVNHKDQNKTNNCVDNLEWCNMVYQVNYGDRNNIVSKKLLNRKDQSKPVMQYTLDMEFVTEYPSIAEAERQTGINKSTIYYCLINKYKQAGGYIWRYKD